MNTNELNGSVLDKVDFKPELFANRIDEIKFLDKKIKQAQQGLMVTQPLVNIWGISGIGKTWLLREIAHEYQFDPDAAGLGEKPVSAIYYDFEAAAEEMPDLTAVAQAFSDLLAESLPAELLAEIEAGEKSLTALQQAVFRIKQLSQKVVPILLLDTAEILPASFWAGFEQQILEPLLTTNQIIVVIAGRRRAPRWRRVEVRRRAAASNECQIGAFNGPEIQEQMARIDIDVSLALANKIHTLSGGNPFLVQRISDIFSGQQSAIPASLGEKSELVKEILTAYKAFVLEDVGASEAMKLAYLEAISVLRFYRTEALRFMLRENDLKPVDPNDVLLLKILRELSETTEVVWWEDSKNGYITAPVLRHVMNQLWLMVDNGSLYLEKHRQALALYWGWVEQFPQNTAVYLLEIIYHQACVDRVMHPDASVLTDSKTILSTVQNSDEGVDIGDVLLNKLRQDEEIERLLDGHILQEIMDNLEKFLTHQPAKADIR